jgi:hypothetical protein
MKIELEVKSLNEIAAWYLKIEPFFFNYGLDLQISLYSFTPDNILKLEPSSLCSCLDIFTGLQKRMDLPNPRKPHFYPS